ncbi:MAG: EamA family transporter, partial [Acinetobacter sp.]|nr:EamA family transporter [Acinetobacter sp.]
MLNRWSDTAQGYFFTVVTMLIWGSFSLLSRVSVHWHIQVWDLLALRFAFAALILIPILIYKKDFRFLFDYRAVILALVGSIGYCCFVYSGFAHAPVVHGIVLLNGLFPVFTAVMAYLFLKQPFDQHTKISLSIIASTVVVMCALIANVNYHFNIGDVYFIGSAICWAGFSVLLRQWTFTAWQVMV